MRLFELNGRTSQQANTNDALRNLVITEMRGETQLFEYLNFYQIVGSADTPRKDATATGGATRAINSDYGNNRTAPAFGAVALKIIGDKVETDQAYERRGGDIASERERELAKFARGIARYTVDQVVNGDSSSVSTDIDGIKKLCDSTQLITLGGGADGATVPLGNDNTSKSKQQQFLEAMYEVARGKDLILMPRKVINRLKSIGRDSVTVTTVEDAVGRKIEITNFDGVPLLDPGYKKDNVTPIITQTETCGASTGICTSVYGVKFGEKENLTYASNVGLVVNDMGLVGTLYTTRAEFDIDSELLNYRAIARLQGVQIP